jgi:SAM-dependent methyltransferase
LDVVLLVNILFQSPNQKEIIEEALRVLKDGGYLVVVDWRPHRLALGPKAKYRLSPEEVREMVGLPVVKELQAGKYHFGFVFQK